MMQITIFVLAGLLILLQLADAWTTITIIRRGGRETNQILVWLASRLPGWTWLALPKLVVCAIAVTLALISGVVATLGLAALVAFYAWVLWNNLSVLKTLKESPWT